VTLTCELLCMAGVSGVQLDGRELRTARFSDSKHDVFLRMNSALHAMLNRSFDRHVSCGALRSSHLPVLVLRSLDNKIGLHETNA